jgi:hypothetical protein
VQRAERAELAAALLGAQRFFSAATILARPAALSFRFAFAALVAATLAAPLVAAHRFRPAALIFRRQRRFFGVFPSDEWSGRMERSSAIWSSILRFCGSKPAIAASMISLVSLRGISLTFWHVIVFSNSAVRTELRRRNGGAVSPLWRSSYEWRCVGFALSSAGMAVGLLRE